MESMPVMATWLPLLRTFSLHTASAQTLDLQQSTDRGLARTWWTQSIHALPAGPCQA